MYIGLLLTLITGLFFLIGIYSLQKIKEKEQTALFTISMAFVVMLGLLTFHLLPELIELKKFWLIIPTILGFLIIILLDKMIPHHHHQHTEDECDKVDHHNHLNHIGLVTIIALAIHNLIEGLTLYSVAISNVKSGVLMMIGIALHNIPLGFQIGNSIRLNRNSRLLIFILCISSFLGALIYILFGSLNITIISILLSLTFGMLLYILIFELFREIKSNLMKREVVYGMLLGIIILTVTFLV